MYRNLVFAIRVMLVTAAMPPAYGSTITLDYQLTETSCGTYQLQQTGTDIVGSFQSTGTLVLQQSGNDLIGEYQLFETGSGSSSPQQTETDQSLTGTYQLETGNQILGQFQSGPSDTVQLNQPGNEIIGQFQLTETSSGSTPEETSINQTLSSDVIGEFTLQQTGNEITGQFQLDPAATPEPSTVGCLRRASAL